MASIDKSTNQAEEQRQHDLQHLTDTVAPLSESDVPERFVDVGGELQAPKHADLPSDVPLQRHITDTDLVSSLVDDRRWRREWDTDKAGIEKPGSERWVELADQRGGAGAAS